MTKRKRCEWWSLLCDEIEANKGFVHAALEFGEEDRMLSVTQKVCKGDLVFRIPAQNFITKNRALSMCQPWLEDITKQPSDGSRIKWNNSVADLSIAVALASCQSPESFLYLHTLPDSSTFDSLPRRWSDKSIQDLLGGTSLLRRVVADKKGVAQDYDTLLKRYRQLENDNSSFPSFEMFSDMLAVITSRAFQIGSTNEDVALVPLLDLGNHTRGKATSKMQKKNVSYQYNADEGVLVVTSTIDIEVGESIRLTYGAKSNAQLLLNYGFCIPENLEPDGSSNDVLEFRIGQDDENSGNSGRKTVALRAGPKSYSYGSFAATLEEYFNEDQATSGVRTQCSEVPADDDFESFLDECDNYNDGGVEEEGNDFMDLYGVEKNESEVLDENEEASYTEEIEALEKFKLDLVKLSQGYKNYKNVDIPTLLSGKSGLNLPQIYSTILSLSELRTIHFFHRAIEKVQILILQCANNREQLPQSRSIDIVTNPADLVLIDTQTDDLAKAYMAIRHGGF